MIRVTIKTRLGISLAATLLVIVGLGIFLLRVQDRLNDSIKNLEAQSVTIQMLSDLELAVQESLMPANDYIITANPRYAREFGELDVKIEELFARLAGKTRLSAPQAEKIAEAHALYGKVKQVAGEIFSRSAKDLEQAGRMETMDYDFGAPMISQVARVKQELELSFSQARKESARLREISNQVSSVALGTVVLLLLFVGLVQVRTISRSLDEVVGMLEQVAEGSGDLTQRLVIRRSDELGRMAELFNRFIDHVHGAIREVVSVTAQLTNSARCMQSASHELHTSSSRQLAVTEQTSLALNGLEQSVTNIAQDAGELSGLATSAASASTELSSSFDEVVRLTEQLDLASDTTLSTVDTINDSSARVATNVADLLDRAQRVVEAVSNVRGMAGEIVESAREQRDIANGVQDDANRLGIIAISDTTSRMERLRTSVSEAAEIMDSLGRMSGEIGRIVSIISEVTGKTNLLALNASIIAAQAGEHGKSFAVVADEVKALAQRTANSTREIELMVEQIREKTESATTAVHLSAEEADAGVIQAREVAATFTTILEKMTAAQVGAEKVASRAERQSDGVEAAMTQIEEMRVMVDQISQAAEEQSRCAEAIVQAAWGMREFTREVRDNVGAQSDENLRITRISQNVFNRVQVVAEVTLQQKVASVTIAEGQREVLAAAIESQVQARAVEETAASLDQQAAMLKKKVGSFKV